MTDKPNDNDNQGNAFLDAVYNAVKEHIQPIGADIIPGYASFVTDMDVLDQLHGKRYPAQIYFLNREERDMEDAPIYVLTFNEEELSDELNSIADGLDYEETTDDQGMPVRMYREPIEIKSLKPQTITLDNGEYLPYQEFLAWLAITAAETEEEKRAIFNAAYTSNVGEENAASISEGEQQETNEPLSKSQLEAIEAGKINRRVARINYSGIIGLEAGYSEACTQLNEMLLKELDKEEPKTMIEYQPNGWGATMRVFLPREEVEAWKESGGTPVQAQRLRAAVYSLLKNEIEPEWWKHGKKVTITLNQIIKGLYKDDRRVSDEEIDRIARTMDMFIKSDLDSIYPEPTGKGKRSKNIDREVLSMKGFRIMPAVSVSEANARGHIVKAAYEFYALPPLEHQSSGLSHSYTIPYLTGLIESKNSKQGKATEQVYDLATVLCRYIRIAKEKGACSVSYETIIEDTEPMKYGQIKTRIEAAIFTGDAEEKKRAQSNLRMLKMRTKSAIDAVMPGLVDNEANREEKPCYLSVDEMEKGSGLKICVVKQTKDERSKHLKPRRYGYHRTR